MREPSTSQDPIRSAPAVLEQRGSLKGSASADQKAAASPASGKETGTKEALATKDEVGVLLAKYNEHRIQARQHETLRGTLTNFVLAIAGGVLALAGSSTALPEFQLTGAVLLVLLGGFGAALAAKHYERFRYHSMLASAYDEKIRDCVKASDLTDFENRKNKHRKKFRLSSWLRAYYLWTALLLCVALLGLGLTVLTVPRYCRVDVRPEWIQTLCGR